MSRAIFGISILMNLVAFGLAARLFAWPRLRALERDRALAWLVAPHMCRFIGLSLLVPGVVSPTLPAAFAVPAAWGDFAAAVLAIVASVALAKRASWAVTAVWVFNLWGTADLIYAFYTGPRSQLEGGDLGASFFIVTFIVPGLLVLHFLIFRLLFGTRR
ncbi:MAG TPA: hypothetical protein VKH43_11830 [Thermoanaerobaculia bacterium]|nr:hypothetical protein [Thermoanaerobaculia bacterium]